MRGGNFMMTVEGPSKISAVALFKANQPGRKQVL